MREKLIEQLSQIDACICTLCGEEGALERVSGVIADHLLYNGVTIPVHCHECTHWKNEINGCTEDKRFCDIGFYMVHKDGYCSFGEKKTENE